MSEREEEMLRRLVQGAPLYDRNNDRVLTGAEFSNLAAAASDRLNEITNLCFEAFNQEIGRDVSNGRRPPATYDRIQQMSERQILRFKDALEKAGYQVELPTGYEICAGAGQIWAYTHAKAGKGTPAPQGTRER